MHFNRSKDYYVLLNSDVEVTPLWIENTIAYLEQDKTIAACQPKYYRTEEKQI